MLCNCLNSFGQRHSSTVNALVKRGPVSWVAPASVAFAAVVLFHCCTPRMAAVCSHVSNTAGACPACRLTRLLADSDYSAADVESQLAAAVAFFQHQPDALDETLFDCLGPIVNCARLSTTVSRMVEAYLQLVVEHCSGREVLTLLMAILDAEMM